MQINKKPKKVGDKYPVSYDPYYDLYEEDIADYEEDIADYSKILDEEEPFDETDIPNYVPEEEPYMNSNLSKAYKALLAKSEHQEEQLKILEKVVKEWIAVYAQRCEENNELENQLKSQKALNKKLENKLAKSLDPSVLDQQYGL